MKASKFATYILQILIVGMLLLAFLPAMPASAATPVINIGVKETVTRATDAYHASQTDGAGGSLTAGTVGGSGQVTLTNNAGTTLTNVHVILNMGQTDTWAKTPGDNRVQSVTMGASTVDIFIPQFDTTSGSIILTYNVKTDATTPVTLSVSYSRNKITDSTSSSTDVTLTANVANGILPADVTSIQPTVVISSAKHVGSDMWTLTTSASGTTENSNVITWIPTTAINVGSSASMVFTATVLDTTNLGNAQNLFEQPLANSVITYAITSSQKSIAGVSVSSVTGSTTQVQTQVSKQFTTGNWVFTPQITISGSKDISYTLNSVTLWATDSASIGTPLTGIGTNPKTDVVGTQLNAASGPATWTGSLAAQQLTFPYSGIPAGFVKPDISITYNNGQFPLSVNGLGSPAVSGSVTLSKYIWIVNGYLVTAQKTITPTGTPGVYNVQILVTNTGNMPTPPNVMVYDIIPSSAWSVSNTIPAPAGTQNIAGGSIGYYWNIGGLSTTAGSNTKTITYTLTGPADGSYTMNDLYVVGVDPALSLNMQSSPTLQNVSKMATANFESLAALGAAGLLLIGTVGNFRRRM